MDPHVLGMTDTGNVKLFGDKLKKLIQDETITPATNPDDKRAEVEAALSASGLVLAPGVTMHVFQNDANNYFVALPHKEQLDQTDAKIAEGEYVLADGYNFACLPQPQPATVTLDFYNFRLGDYVLQHCQ